MGAVLKASEIIKVKKTIPNKETTQKDWKTKESLLEVCWYLKLIPSEQKSFSRTANLMVTHGR